MRIDYDPGNDTVYIRLHETPRTNESDEVEPGVIVDYGSDGQVVGFELLDAKRRGCAFGAIRAVSCRGVSGPVP